MERLKELREKRGYTQVELAKLLDIDRTAVAKYETGVNGAKSEILLKMADLFGVSTDYLLGRTDKKESAPEVVAEFSADELQLVKDYRELNGEGQSFVRTTVRSLVVSGAYIKSRISGQVQIG